MAKLFGDPGGFIGLQRFPLSGGWMLWIGEHIAIDYNPRARNYSPRARKHLPVRVRFYR